MISAEVHSDDHVFEATFDASKWAEQADDTEIEALAKCGFGGDYAADAVAQFMADHDEDVKKVFSYLDLKPKMGNGDPVGFECHVEEEDLAMWLDTNRPAMARSLRENGLLAEFA